MYQSAKRPALHSAAAAPPAGAAPFAGLEGPFTSLSGIPARPIVQRKLMIGADNDPAELEADRMADAVLRMSGPAPSLSSAPAKLSRKCADCEEKPVQRKATGAKMAGEAAPAVVDSVVASPGRSLDPETNAFMSSRFGTDFDNVRIHTDAQAAQSATAVGARAYTIGRDVVFGAGQYDPAGASGRHLLAHELAHVMQQGAHATRSERLQAKRNSGASAPKSICPAIEVGEKEDSNKAKLNIVETVKQQEWLISGFPIGGSGITEVESASFIGAIIRSLAHGHFLYVTGQDPLEVIGFSDCLAGPKWDNQLIRKSRADNFCAGVKAYLGPSDKSYTNLIRRCEAAPIDHYVGSNATRADRSRNRSILVRRVPREPFFYQKGNERFPYNPGYGPSEAHCAAYTTDIARRALGRIYTNNAHCSCKVTPDEPHNNCVRDCLQNKMWSYLAQNAADGEGPPDALGACMVIWKHHRECYHDCGCESEFIDFWAFDGVCNVALPCPVDSAAINLLNRCMPATAKDKYLPVD
jgi:Domain of unknown function (DUF4157)